MGSTTLTTTTANNKNNKPRCYPQQRFGISFRYSLNEKILKKFTGLSTIYVSLFKRKDVWSCHRPAMKIQQLSSLGNYLAVSAKSRAHKRWSCSLFFAASETCVIQIENPVSRPEKQYAPWDVHYEVCGMCYVIYDTRHVFCHIRHAAQYQATTATATATATTTTTSSSTARATSTSIITSSCGVSTCSASPLVLYGIRYAACCVPYRICAVRKAVCPMCI